MSVVHLFSFWSIRVGPVHRLLEHITHRVIDDEVGGTVDDKEEIANTDKNRDPDGALTATTGVKE